MHHTVQDAEPFQDGEAAEVGTASMPVGRNGGCGPEAGVTIHDGEVKEP